MLSIFFISVACIAFYLSQYKASALELNSFANSKLLNPSSKGISFKTSRLHSRPIYHGLYTAISSALIPALLIIITLALFSYYRDYSVISIFRNNNGGVSNSVAVLKLSEIRNLALGVLDKELAEPGIMEAVNHYKALDGFIDKNLIFLSLLFAILGFIFSYKRISIDFPARIYCENLLKFFLMACSLVAILTTVGIICSLLFESLRFFQIVSLYDFLFGLKWSPQIAIRSDQVASAGAFGAVPIFTGTILIAFIALCVAGPCGLFSAIYLSEYANPYVRKVMKPVLEILAGIPTVVFGFFAALTVAPIVKDFGTYLGLDVSSESALAAGLVMGVMIIPFISSLSNDVINAVPQTLRDGSYALGATKSETIKKVIIPAALPGIVGSFMLAISRAIGETMIVVMAAGLAANLTLNPFENVTTVTVQIVTALVGDQEFDSAKTLSVFALGLVLFCITLVLNIFSMQLVKRYREQYE